MLQNSGTHLCTVRKDAEIKDNPCGNSTEKTEIGSKCLLEKLAV